MAKDSRAISEFKTLIGFGIRGGGGGSIFAILKIGIRYLAQICSRVKEKNKNNFFFEMTLFAIVTAAILDF